VAGKAGLFALQHHTMYRSGETQGDGIVQWALAATSEQCISATAILIVVCQIGE
jgi:hypothetical protein